MRTGKVRSAQRLLGLVTGLAFAVAPTSSPPALAATDRTSAPVPASHPAPEAPVIGYSHVAIGVRDIDAALVFYRDVLGMSVTARTRKQGLGKVPDREAAYLRWERGMAKSFVVLDRVVGNPSGKPAEFFELGFHHIGFDVHDVDRLVERARAHGIRVLREPALSDAFDFGYSSRPGGEPIVKSATLQDPDGNIVQLDQWLNAPAK